MSLPFNVQACKSHSETSPGDDAAQHTDTCTVTAYVSLGDVSTPTLTEAAPVATQHEGGLDCVLEGMHLPLTEHRLRGPKRAGACDRGGATRRSDRRMESVTAPKNQLISAEISGNAKCRTLAYFLKNFRKLLFMTISPLRSAGSPAAEDVW